MSDVFFNLEGWKTPNSYSTDFAPLPRGCAVYVIVRPLRVPDKALPSGYGIVHKLLYVGMSTNLKQRFVNHEIKQIFDRRRDYVQVWFKRVSQKQLRTRERRLIQKFNPPYNIIHRVRGEVDG